MKEQTGDSVSSPQSPLTDGAVTKQNLVRLGAGGVYGAMVARTVISNVRQSIEMTSGNEALITDINNAFNGLSRMAATLALPKIAIPAMAIEGISEGIMRSIRTTVTNQQMEYERKLQGARIWGVNGFD